METGSAFWVGGLRENIVANPLALWDDLTRFVDVNTDRSDRALLTNKMVLTLCFLVSSADNLGKQFGLRSGTTTHRAWSGSKLFDTDGIPEKVFWKKGMTRINH